MAGMAAIFKFFKRHLLSNPKSDWAETWWEASQWHRVSKLFCFEIHDMATRGGHLEILQTTLLLNPWKPYVRKSWNLLGGITVTQRFRIAKIILFRYPRWWPAWNSSNDISSQSLSQIESKLDGRHHSYSCQRFRIAKIVPFQYPRWLPGRPSWNSLNDISSKTISQIVPKLYGRYWCDIEIQNC